MAAPAATWRDVADADGGGSVAGLPTIDQPSAGADVTGTVTRLRAAGCVFAEDEARLLHDAARTAADLDAMIRRRTAGLPVEHVVGWARFCGLRIAVTQGVFIPRRRTEHLAGRAAALARPRAVVVDLCCGAGAVGAAVRAAHDSVELYASDIDPVAVRCARRNLPDGRVYRGDLFEPLPTGLRRRVNVLVANAPYVPTARLPLLPAEARRHEPRAALDGGDDGLDVVRRVIADAPSWLAPGGHLLFEVGEQQVPPAADAVVRAGLTVRVSRCDELDATAVIATLPAGPGQNSEP